MKLIGIAGKARSGKDTAAKHLIERHGLVKYSFADPLKAGVKTMFGLTEQHINGDLKETVIPWLGVSPRRLMQTIGTEWGREMIRSDLWVLMAKRQWDLVKCATTETFHGGMIVPDIRFEEEAEFIRQNGGVVVHLIREDLERVESHKSEAGVTCDPFKDLVVENNGTIGELCSALDRLPFERFGNAA